MPDQATGNSCAGIRYWASSARVVVDGESHDRGPENRFSFSFSSAGGYIASRVPNAAPSLQILVSVSEDKYLVQTRRKPHAIGICRGRRHVCAGTAGHAVSGVAPRLCNRTSLHLPGILTLPSPIRAITVHLVRKRMTYVCPSPQAS